MYFLFSPILYLARLSPCVSFFFFQLLFCKKWKKPWLNVLPNVAVAVDGLWIIFLSLSSIHPPLLFPSPYSDCTHTNISIMNWKRTMFPVLHYLHTLHLLCVIISGLALVSLQGVLPLYQPKVTAREICICFWSGAGCYLRVTWGSGDARPECSRLTLWMFDGSNEQVKCRTKHFIGLLDLGCVRRNIWQERMKYWKVCDNSIVRK